MKKTLLAVIFTILAIPAIASASLWSWYAENNQNLPSISARIPIAVQCDIYGYSGSYTQNLLLESCLRGGLLGGALGNTLPIAGSTYNLAGSGVTGSASSITLQSLTITQTGQKITDSDLSDTFYITLEPGNSKRQEISACTTVTQNSGGTATLSGCSRGMSPIYPYTASSTLQVAHTGGTQVIFSNPPQLYNELGYLGNNNTWQKYNIFGTSTESTIKGMIGIGTSTPAYIKNESGILYYCNNGAACTVIGTGANTYSFIRPLVNPSGSEIKLATSTYDFTLRDNLLANATSSISGGTASGKALDDLFNARWNATTTKESLMINSSSTVNGIFKVNGNATTTGSLYAGEYCDSTGCQSSLGNKKLYASSTNMVISDTASTTVATFTVPANSLTGTNSIFGKIFGYISAPAGRVLQAAIKMDSTYILYGQRTYAKSATTTEMIIGAHNSSTEQISTLVLPVSPQNSGGNYFTAQSNIDMTAARTFTFEVKWVSSGGTFNYNNAYFELIR